MFHQSACAIVKYAPPQDTTQPSRSEVFVNVSDCPYQPKNFEDSKGDIGDLLSERHALEKSRSPLPVMGLLKRARIERFCSQSCPTSST